MSQSRQTVRVTRVIDGDTVEVKTGGSLLRSSKKERIRLYGIDAPESKQKGGSQSARHLRHLIGSEKRTWLEARNTDQYGRTIGVIYHRNHTPADSYNYRMVQAGHAHCYMLSRSDQSHYQHAQEQARKQRLGLWKEKNPTPPWEWRKTQRRSQSAGANIKFILIFLIILALAAGAIHLYQRLVS